MKTLASPPRGPRNKKTQRSQYGYRARRSERAAVLEDAAVLLQPAVVGQRQGALSRLAAAPPQLVRHQPAGEQTHAPSSLTLLLHPASLGVRPRSQMLRTAFEAYGEVVDAFVAYNGRSSRGFGYVTFKLGDNASKAVRAPSLPGSARPSRRLSAWHARAVGSANTSRVAHRSLGDLPAANTSVSPLPAVRPARAPATGVALEGAAAADVRRVTRCLAVIGRD